MSRCEKRMPVNTKYTVFAKKRDPTASSDGSHLDFLKITESKASQLSRRSKQRRRSYQAALLPQACMESIDSEASSE